MPVNIITQKFTPESGPRPAFLRRWLTLGLGMALIWFLTYWILPWGQTLPHVQPVMKIISEANIDAGMYFYTQSEETVQAQTYVRQALRRSD